MSDYTAADVASEHELEVECSCEDRRLLEQARAIAVRLEAEQAALQLIAHCALHTKSESGRKYTEEEDGAAKDALFDFIYGGSLSDEAFALAARLEQS